VDQRIKAADLKVEQIATSDAAYHRLRTIPDIGPLISMAIVAAIGNGAAFRKGRVCGVRVTCSATTHNRRQGAAAPHQKAQRFLFDQNAIQHREFIDRSIMLPIMMAVLRLSIAELNQDILVV
jgi:hypothetical protein